MHRHPQILPCSSIKSNLIIILFILIIQKYLVIIYDLLLFALEILVVFFIRAMVLHLIATKDLSLNYIVQYSY
jgi:hypothetical protein